jgi:hypothetical protein
MMAVVLIGWYTLDVAKAAIDINSALMFGFMGIFLVQQNVELERYESRFYADNIIYLFFSFFK